MKTRNLLFVLLSASMILFSNCQGDDDDDLVVEPIGERDYHPEIASYPPGALLRKVYTTGFEQSGPEWLAHVYEYDTNDQLIKVSSPMYDEGTITRDGSYDLYEYNTAGQLIRKEYYNYNHSGEYWNLRTTHYTYNDEGLIIKERIEYPKVNRSDYSLLHYEKQHLVKKEYFYQEALQQTTTVYEYTSGQVSREKEYSNGECYKYITHAYKDDLLITSATYETKSAAEGPARITRYYYDANHHLVHTTHEELSLLSSAMSYSTWYEYE
jgi:hypothetical protein